MNCYSVILDAALSKLERRFEQMEPHNRMFNFFNDLYNLLKTGKSNRSATCKAFENILYDPSKNGKDTLTSDLYDIAFGFSLVAPIMIGIVFTILACPVSEVSISSIKVTFLILSNK